MRRLGVSIAIATALSLGADAAAADRLDHDHEHGHRHVLPDRLDDPAAAWSAQGAWLVSPAEAPDGGGTRVAAMLEVTAGAADINLEARGVSASATGSWHPMEATHRDDGLQVAVLDLDARWDRAQLRLAAADAERVDTIAWELLVPRYPDAGVQSREATEPGAIYAVGPALTRIGVRPRADWGARPTTCSATEDNWYRMAIHHTAGPQISGGTLEATLRGLQAYAMDSGTWCDIPYQFLVGYDGSLWEGRSLTYTSGATGGGNNPGNIAVCFIGCYHPSGCPGNNSHAATEEMMWGARVLVQTLARLHDIVTDSNLVRGHRDWPGNSTACPGNYVHERLGELRADLAWFAAEETARSFDPNAPIEVGVGDSVEVWVELVNRGGLPWEPGITHLGTTGNRDDESLLADPSWPNPTRAATVESPVAPGEVGRFSFRVRADMAGELEQSFGLVHDGVTWFADAPWGGGPGDDAIIVRILADDDDGGGAPDGPGIPIDPDDPTAGTITGGCATAPGAPAPVALLLLAAAALRRRRRR